jgi:RND family efflux transporter MFP subunit
VLELANTEYKRNKTLYLSKAISQKMNEQSISNYKKATAELSRARQNIESLVAEKKATEQALTRTKTLLAYSEIRSPMDGIVSERAVDPGDLAIPGKILIKVFDTSRLMLEIPVRESLIKKIKLGEKVAFDVKALNKTYYGEIKEIVPYVDTKTRSFLVKVCIDKTQGQRLVPGMYGVAKMKIGSKKELLIPKGAVTRIGQTETVIVEEKNKFIKVFVRTIESPIPDMRTVLSGLYVNDKVLIK